jgi:hypothetical protein
MKLSVKYFTELLIADLAIHLKIDRDNCLVFLAFSLILGTRLRYFLDR